MKKINKSTTNKKSLITQLRAMRRVVLVTVFSAIFVSVILLFGNANSALAAFTTITQSNWSAGQYTEKRNLVASTPGQLTLDSGTIGNWCNIDANTCDSSWPYRQQLNITSDQSRTDYQLYFTVNYEPAMQSDFRDLRFTLFDGTPLYWTTGDNFQTGVSTDVYVKVPVLSQGVNALYMYYGNPTANGYGGPGDVFDFYDNFPGSSVDTNKWDVNGNIVDAITVSSNALHFDNSAGLSPGNGGLTPITDPISRDDPKRFEFGMNVVSLGSTADNTCSTIGPNMYNVIDWSNAVDDHGINFSCQGSSDKFSVQAVDFLDGSATTVDLSTNGDYGNEGWYVRYAIEPTATGAKYYKSNNWTTLQQFTTGTTGMTRTPLNPTIYVGGTFTNTKWNMSYARIYKTGASLTVNYGLEESFDGKVGRLTSTIFDLGGTSIMFGNATIQSSGTGLVGLQVRNGNQPDLSDAPDFDTCNIMASGSAINTSSCVTFGKQYVQYRLQLSADAVNDLQVNEVSLEYLLDDQAPNVATGLSIKRSATGLPLSNAGWTNTATPYFSWSAASDNGEAGVAGYCVYLGEDETADPITTSGILPVYSDPNYNGINTGGACQYITDGTNIDLASFGTPLNVQSGHRYYLVLKTIDSAGNISGSSSSVNIQIDTNTPFAGTLINAPIGTNSKIFNVTWISNSPAYVTDDASGVAGFKYCVTNLLLGFSGCDPTDPSSKNFYGLAHTSGDINDTSDVIPFGNSEFSTVAADAARLDDAVGLANGVYVFIVDNAGNWSFVGNKTVIITQLPPGAPENLSVTPTSNTANSFSFSWNKPTFSIGSDPDVDYCWTVNEDIASNGSNCHWTGKGITQLAAGAYATQQGTNTFRIMAKDVTGNFSSANVASVDFTANTTAPGPPRNLDSSDVSVRATSTWKIALSWNAPTLPGSGVSAYKIMRSIDDVNFSQVGTTSSSNTSFIDSGLQQVLYYYRVLACDSANNCSVPSNEVNRTPTGRFTEPARLTSDTDQPKVKNISTKKATVYWFTDRASDSKVAYGTASGQYSPAEVGNATQTAAHEVQLTNLQPSTTYYYITKWTDQDGNTGQSQERTFTTAPAPTIAEVTTTNASIDGATINFVSTNAAKVAVYYGINSPVGGSKSINTATRTSSYSLRLSDLQDGTKYLFKINGLDADGNEYAGNVYAFTTPSRPKISNVRFQPVDGEPSSTMKVTWVTNVPSTSQVVYAPVGGKTIELLDTRSVTQHEVVIRELQDDSTYNLTARSADEGGNVAVSDPQAFRTALDTRQPKISNVSIETSINGSGADSHGQVIVSWKTDEKASSQVAFSQGQTGTLTSFTAEDGRLSTEHTVVLSDLSTSTVYKLQAVSFDKARNAGKSEVQTAIIGRGSENVFTIIFNALQQIFGL